MAKYFKATPEGEIPMTPEEEAYWDNFLAEQNARFAAQRLLEEPTPTIPTSTP
jgi:hypothetical protein